MQRNYFRTLLGVEVRAEKVPDGISAEDHAAGFASSLANLAVYLQPGATTGSTPRPPR